MRISRNTIAGGAVIGLLSSAIAGLRANPDALQGGLVNPDSAMRLVRLEAMIQAHAPLSAVARDGSGAGTMLHWSHLLDSLLLLLAAPVAAFTGWHQALSIVAPLVGPLSMAALGGALVWAAAPFVGRQWRWLPALLASVFGPVLGYGLPGVVHHHVLLAAIAAVVAGWALRIVWFGRDGVGLGAWAAVGVWLSPESMPLSLMAICLVWCAWLLHPRAALARSLAETGLAMFAVTTVAWLADPPAAGLWAIEQDRISIVFVTMGAAAALCGVGAFAGLPRWGVMALGGVLASAWVAAFPVVLAGSYGVLPADVAHEFMDDIAEMQPVRSLDMALRVLLPAGIGAAVLAALAIRRRSALLLYAAGCAALLVLGGAQHVRFSTYPAVLAAALAPVALTALGATRWRTAALGLAAAWSLAPYAVATGSAAQPAGKACGMHGVGALLAPYRGEVVLGSVNDTPDLLWRTGVLTVGSLYHRSPGGFMRLRAAWRSEPGQAMPPAVAATGARLVLVCPSAPLPRFTAGSSGPTLAAALKAGDVPPWLHRVGDATVDGYVLYRAE